MEILFCFYLVLLLEPADNKYRGSVDLPFLNGLIRIAFIHGNEHLEREDGTPLDGKILFGSTIVAPGDQYRETGRKSVRYSCSMFYFGPRLLAHTKFDFDLNRHRNVSDRSISEIDSTCTELLGHRPAFNFRWMALIMARIQVSTNS